MRARRELARIGISVEPASKLGPIAIAERSARTKLAVVSSGDGESFRYTYLTLAHDSHDDTIDVSLDAETGALTHFEYPHASGCTHGSTGDVIVTGTPQNTANGTQTLHANTPGQQPGFPYDGVSTNLTGRTGWNAGVLQQTTDATYKCTADAESYSLFPVGGTYNSAPLPWRGDIATDALRFTVATWEGFAAINPVYRNEFQFYSDRWAVVQADVNGGVDDSWWFRDASALHPADSINFLPSSVHRYTLAAALDMVAHEWGHSVIHFAAGWSNIGTQGEMNEGYADVVGQAIEKITAGQPSADWDVGEDMNTNGSYLRSGNRYDGDFGHYAGTNGTYFFNNRFHREDTAGSPEIHQVGNALNVAFFLLSMGGQNPVCADHGLFQGCDTPGVTAIGLFRARRTLIEALWYYSYPSEGWNDIGTAAAVAARDTYWNTPDCPLIQNSIVQAFTKIGYPPRIDASGGPPYQCFP